MKFDRNLVRNYPLSCLCVAVIWILCFCTPPHTPLDNVAFMDKWMHMAMYAGTCSIVWFEYLRRHKSLNKIRLLTWAWLAPVLMSGLIELLQAYCIGGRRSGDWLDFAANTVGATLAVLIGILMVKCRAKR